MHDEMFETPEGFTLPRRLLLPEVRRFDEVLTFVRHWDHRTMTHTSGKVPHPELVPAPAKIGDNEIGPFCSVNMRDRRYSLAVIATPLTLEAIEPRIVTDDDRLSFEVIYHQDTNRCLVLAQHNYIIGSHWLAYVDPATVPAAPKEDR